MKSERIATVPDLNRSPVISSFTRSMGKESPVEAMRERVRRLLVECFGDPRHDVPIDIAAVAKCCGLEVTWTSGEKEISTCRGARGVLRPVPGGFKVMLFGTFPRSSENMTIAHEIGHTFFYDSTHSVPQRPYGLPPTNAEEELCEFAARSILLPEEQIRKFTPTGASGPVSKAICDLARLANVTIHSAATRLVVDMPDISESIGLVAAILWTRRGSSIFSHEVICPKWSVGRYFIPLAGRCHVEEGSLVHRTFCDPSFQYTIAPTTVCIGNLRGSFFVDVFTPSTVTAPKWVLACYRRPR